MRKSLRDLRRMDMIDEAYRRYRLLEEILETDGEYLWLAEQSREIGPRVEELLRMLPEEDRDILTGYMGICQEKVWRIVELACFLP